MWECLGVALGGALGSLARYGLVILQQSFGLMHTTLLVNVLGCFVAGMMVAFASQNGALALLWHRMLVIGFLGGFTSFSSFAIEWWVFSDTGAGVWLYPMMVMVATLAAFASGFYGFKWLH